MSHDITITLSAIDRNLILRHLKTDDSELALSLRERIEYLVQRERDDAARWRASQDRSARFEAARVVASIFAERHAVEFPGTDGRINQNVWRGVERQATAMLLGEGSEGGLTGVRAEYREAVQALLDALLEELQTPEGMSRAVAHEAQRLRAVAAYHRAEPLYADLDYNEESCRETEAEADELERAAIIPGLVDPTRISVERLKAMQKLGPSNAAKASVERMRASLDAARHQDVEGVSDGS